MLCSHTPPFIPDQIYAMKSRRPAFQRAFEGEKAHGHCAVGLELFPRPQSSGVQEFSQAGKAQFTHPAKPIKFNNLLRTTKKVCKSFPPAPSLTISVEVLCIDRLTGKTQLQYLHLVRPVEDFICRSLHHQPHSSKGQSRDDSE